MAKREHTSRRTPKLKYYPTIAMQVHALLLFALLSYNITGGKGSASNNMVNDDNLRRRVYDKEDEMILSCLVVEVEYENNKHEKRNKKVERRCIFQDDDGRETIFWIDGISDSDFWKNTTENDNENNNSNKFGDSSVEYWLQFHAAEAALIMRNHDALGKNILRIKQNSTTVHLVGKEYDQINDWNSIYLTSQNSSTGVGHLSSNSRGDYNDTGGENGNYKKRSLTIKKEGTSTVLVIRVTDSMGNAPTKSATELSNDIFYDRHNLVSRYYECSGGKLQLLPATSSNSNIILDGVSEILIPHPLCGVVSSTAEDSVMDAAYELLGSLHQWTHVLFIFPACVEFGGYTLAYTYLNYHLAFFKDTASSSLQALVHEVGHQLGLTHSSESNQYYGDSTCMMGNSRFEDDSPVMCFNGAKSWSLGWYSDRHVKVDPLYSAGDYNDPLFVGKMVGIDDYVNDQIPEDSDEYYVIAKVGRDIYVMYNRKEGINAEVQEKGDLVTVVKQEEGENAQSTDSWLLAGIDAGEEWRYPSWGREHGEHLDDCTLVIKVCEKAEGTPDYATIIIYMDNEELGGSRNIPCDTPLPIMVPISSLPTTPTPAVVVDTAVYITFDDFPEETRWSIVDNETGEVVRYGPFDKFDRYDGGLAGRTIKETFQTTRGRSYTFNVFDSFGDGFCCQNGFGKYMVAVDGSVIVSSTSGDQQHFEYSDSQIFTIPNPSSTTTAFPTSLAPTLSPTRTPTSTPTTFLPTFSPTLVAPTHVPTVVSDQVVSSVYITFDYYPEETSWSLSDNESGEVIRKVPFQTYGSDLGGQTFEETFKLTRGRSYTFTIFDSFGDGFCCAFGLGKYVIFADGSVVATSGEQILFEFSQSADFLLV